MKNALRIATVALALPLAAAGPAGAEDPPPRTIAVVSDLHFGVGPSSKDGKYPAFEDFRWPVAWEGFLDAVSKKGTDRVDLVIAGDLFELWQHPGVACESAKREDYGCTVNEMTKIVTSAISAHSRELAALGAFSARGENHVYVVPGNHDAALLVDDIWKVVAPAFGKSARA